MISFALLLPCAVLAGGAVPSADPGGTQSKESTPSNTHAAKRSIRDWVGCKGEADDSDGMARAFAAARHEAFTLVVDCPIRMRIGTDISHAIFIDSGTTVEFSGTGKLTVDNVLVPAFVIANSSDIALTGWNVEYDAGLPINPIIPGYVVLGKTGNQPSGAFNDFRLTPWLAANRGIVFDGSQGRVTSKWTGSTNMCALFFMSGDTSRVSVTGMQVRVPPNAGGDRFVPVVFSLNPNFKSNQTITAKTPMTGEFFAVPHDLRFENISLDGTYMGWVGSTQDTVIENIRSARYGDLQDAHGGNSGGIRKWFAPPHLFYFSGAPVSDGNGLSNRNLQIRNVDDQGVRVGSARDGASETLSGNALSLKIGCSNCVVDHYKSARPDGFLDVLTSDGLTLSNVQAVYNSAFLNHRYPGWRFPQVPYSRLTFENVSLTDAADSTRQQPIGNTTALSDPGIIMKNVQVEMNRWEAQNTDPLPKITGPANEVSLNYFMKLDASRMVRSQHGPAEMTLRATPVTAHIGEAVTVTWATKEAGDCEAGGAWSGSVPATGSRPITLSSVGDSEIRLQCGSGEGAVKGAIHVTVLR
jgi:hypothetical protein